MDCDLGHPKKLKLVVDLIFEKAVDESKYCRLYALLCRTLNQEVPNYEPDPSPCTTFQKSLMNKLQVILNIFQIFFSNFGLQLPQLGCIGRNRSSERFRLKFNRKSHFPMGSDVLLLSAEFQTESPVT